MAMKWRKRGLVFAANGQYPWARSHAFMPTAILLDERTIRVYCAVLDAAQVGRVIHVDVSGSDPTQILAVGRNLTLDVGELGCFDDNGVNASSVIAWRGNKWMYYIGWQHAVRVPYMLFSGLAISGDGGETFTRNARVPVLDRTSEEPFSRSAPCVIVDGNRLRMWYWSSSHWTASEGRQPHYNTEINYAESNDGVEWTVLQRGCIKPEGDEYAVGRPWAIAENGLVRLWYSIRSHARPYRIGYAESPDGMQFTRRDDLVGIERSDSGWDSEMICFPCVIDFDGRRYMFYNGNRHGATGFGVAELESV